MKTPLFSSFLNLTFLFFLGVFIAGCAEKIPALRSLSRNEAAEARLVLEQFFARRCWSLVDCDVTCDWRIFGNQGAVPGMLQMQAPARVRYTALDPLGRPRLILVTDEDRFRLAVIPEARGYEGRADSESRRRYLPGELKSRDLFVWLAGGLRKKGIAKMSPAGKERSGAGYWYELKYDDDTRHRVLLDSEGKVLRRHLLVDASGEIIFDVRYRDYGRPEECPWPGTVVVTGGTLTGTVTLRYANVTPVSRFSPGTFKLDFPPGFRVESVD